MRKRQRKKNLYKLWLCFGLKPQRRALYNIDAWEQCTGFVNRHDMTQDMFKAQYMQQPITVTE